MKKHKYKILGACLIIGLIVPFNAVSAADDAQKDPKENIELVESADLNNNKKDIGMCYSPAPLEDVDGCADCLKISNIFDSEPSDNVSKNFKQAFEIMLQSEFGSMVFDTARSADVPLIYDQELVEKHKNADGLLNISNGSYVYNKDLLMEVLEDEALTNFVDTISHEFFHAYQLSQSTEVMQNYRGMEEKDAIAMALGIEIPAYMFATVVIHDLVSKGLLSKFDVIASESNIVKNLYRIYDDISKTSESGQTQENIGLFAETMLSSNDPWISFFRLDLMRTAMEEGLSGELKEELSSNLPDNASNCLREFSRMANGEYLLPKGTSVEQIDQLLKKDLVLEQIYYGDIYNRPDIEEVSIPQTNPVEELVPLTGKANADIITEKKTNSTRGKDEPDMIKKLRKLFP